MPIIKREAVAKLGHSSEAPIENFVVHGGFDEGLDRALRGGAVNFVSHLCFSDSSERDAIQAQLAAAMASADYAARKYLDFQIDHAKIKALNAKSGKSPKQLRASESYAEQRDTIASIEKGPHVALICQLLPTAHSGYARGVIE